MRQLISALLCAAASTLPAQTLQTIPQRAAYTIAALPNTAAALQKGHHEEFQLWAVQSLYLRGLDQHAETLALAALPHMHEPAHPDDDSFKVISALDLLERWQSHFTPSTAKAFESTLTQFPYWNASHTSNQLLMSAAARFLASEAYPHATIASPFTPEDPTGRAYLLCLTTQIATHNLQEFDSDVYSAAYFISLRTLADFARDPQVKQQAALTYDWLLINAASTWMHATWAATSFRRYFDIVPQNQMEHGSFALWPWFGGPTPGANFNIEHTLGAIQDAAACHCVPTLHPADGPTYIPRPEILDLIAASSTLPHYEFRARTVTPSRPTFQFMQTSYITPNYALIGEADYETATHTKQSTPGSGAAVLSAVLWNPTPQNSPYPSLFYATAPRWQVDLTDTHITKCTTPQAFNCVLSRHTFGQGRHGQYFQSGDAQLGVFNYNLPGIHEPNQFYIYAPLCTANQYPWKFPDDGPIPHQPCAKPTIPRALITSETQTKGRLYLFYDNVLISLWLSAPFTWDGLHELSIYDPATLNPHSLLASAIEVASPTDFPAPTPAETLAAFKKSIESHATLDTTQLTGDHPAATYRTSSGALLQNTFGLTDSLNGKPIDYTTWPLLQTPWVNQPWSLTTPCTLCFPGRTTTNPTIGGGQSLTLTDPLTHHTLTYDFTHWTITQ